MLTSASIEMSMVIYTDWYLNVKPYLHPYDKTLFAVFSSLRFVEGFWNHVMMNIIKHFYIFVVCHIFILTLCWPQKWVRKYSLFLYFKGCQFLECLMEFMNETTCALRICVCGGSGFIITNSILFQRGLFKFFTSLCISFKL